MNSYKEKMILSWRIKSAFIDLNEIDEQVPLNYLKKTKVKNSINTVT